MKFTTATRHLIIGNRDYAIIRIDLDLTDPREKRISDHCGKLSTYYTTLEWEKDIKNGWFNSSDALLMMQNSIPETIEYRRFIDECVDCEILARDYESLTEEQRKERKETYFALSRKHEARLAEIRARM